LAQIGRAKDAIFAEARDTLEVQDQMLRLVLNEAEALAWQTRFPHLFFPALAVEKVQEAAAWDSRQRAVAGRTRASY
jgi:predicted secreted hydrolase